MRAVSTVSGACTNGSIALPGDATRRAPGCVATTSTTRAEPYERVGRRGDKNVMPACACCMLAGHAGRVGRWAARDRDGDRDALEVLEAAGDAERPRAWGRARRGGPTPGRRREHRP